MSSYYTEKNTSESYRCQISQKEDLIRTSSQSFFKSNKQNVVPGMAQLQGLISNLNKNKYELKNLQAEQQQYKKLALEQYVKIQAENIRQLFEAQKQEELFIQNQKMLNQIQQIKRQKPTDIQKIKATTKSLQSRYHQIIQLKKMKQQLSKDKKEIQIKQNQITQQNVKLQSHINQLELTIQTQNNLIFNKKQEIRQNSVNITTIQSAINVTKRRNKQIITEIRSQNQQNKNLIKQGHQINEKTKKIRSQKQEHQIISLQFQLKNKEIDYINIKLKSDLEKCKAHLQCLLKINQSLKNSIQEFTYVDERVTKIVNRNQLKKF